MLLEVEVVGFRYPGRSGDAVRSVSFSIPRGQLVSIVGANGSGKSTLMKVLARVIEPGSGRVRFDGRMLEQWERRAYARRVGYLAQEAESVFPTRALDLVLSARAPFLGRFEWESDEDLDRARRSLAECDAADLAERFLDQMSGGERKRVELARVLAGEPDLLLLDEPLAALDLAHVQQLARLLRAIASDGGRTVLFVSHDLNWSAAVADRMIVMRAGEIAADGPPSEILSEGMLRAAFELEAEVVQRGARRWIVPRL